MQREARNKSEFFAEFMIAAKKMPDRFCFADLRKKVRVFPTHPNWWGNAAQKLKTLGYHVTGWTLSNTESRRRGIEALWSK